MNENHEISAVTAQCSYSTAL